jgi:hypothetical protein
MMHATLPSTSRHYQDDALRVSLSQLQKALAVEGFEGKKAWAGAMWFALARVETKLRQHLEGAKSADGVLAEVDDTRATLVREQDRLVQEYSNRLEQVIALKWEMFRAAKGKDCPDLGKPARFPEGLEVSDWPGLRRRAEHFLAELNKDKEAETDLIMESLHAEIGVGD